MTSTPRTSTPANSSRTQIVTDAAPQEGSSSNPDPIGTLRLRAGRRNRPRVVWKDDVVDNEGCGRKSSKICCIYHKPRKFDESSSEDDSDSDSDSAISDARRRLRRHAHDHNHNHDHDHNPQNHTDEAPVAGSQIQTTQSETICEIEKDKGHNAYERLPKSNKGKQREGPS